MDSTIISLDTSFDMDMAERVANKLTQVYPDYLWAVTVQDGVIIVKNLMISSIYGFIIKLRDLYGDPDLKLAMRAGGELLERAHLKRGAATGEWAKQLEGSDPKKWRPH